MAPHMNMPSSTSTPPSADKPKTKAFSGMSKKLIPGLIKKFDGPSPADKTSSKPPTLEQLASIAWKKNGASSSAATSTAPTNGHDQQQKSSGAPGKDRKQKKHKLLRRSSMSTQQELLKETKVVIPRVASTSGLTLDPPTLARTKSDHSKGEDHQPRVTKSRTRNSRRLSQLEELGQMQMQQQQHPQPTQRRRSYGMAEHFNQSDMHLSAPPTPRSGTESPPMDRDSHHSYHSHHSEKAKSHIYKQHAPQASQKQQQRHPPPPFERSQYSKFTAPNTASMPDPVHVDDSMSSKSSGGSKGPHVNKPRSNSFHSHNLYPAVRANKNQSKRQEGRRRSPHPAEREFSNPPPKQHQQPKQSYKKKSSEKSSFNPPENNQPASNINARPSTPLPSSLDSLNMSSRNNTDNADVHAEGRTKLSGDMSIETVHTLDSLDAHKLHTAEQLRDLIEMMQTEFQKLRTAKVNAEMKAHTLETDLVSSQQERDAEFVKLSEENEHWKRVAHQEKVQYERLQIKVEQLERENAKMKKEWGKVVKGKQDAEERCEKLVENEKRMFKKFLKHQRSSSARGDKESPLAHKDSSSHDDSSSQLSVATTSKVGSPTRDFKRYHTPPSSPPPFEPIPNSTPSNTASYSSQYLQHPQTVRPRRHYQDRTPSSNDAPQAPASWHGGKKRSVRQMPIIVPPLESGGTPTNTMNAASSSSRFNSHSKGSGLRRKSSQSSSASTARSSVSTLRDSTLNSLSQSFMSEAKDESMLSMELD